MYIPEDWKDWLRAHSKIGTTAGALSAIALAYGVVSFLAATARGLRSLVDVFSAEQWAYLGVTVVALLVLVAVLPSIRAWWGLVRAPRRPGYTYDGVSWDILHEDEGPRGYRMLINIEPDYPLAQPLTLRVRCSAEIGFAVSTLYRNKRRLEHVRKTDNTTAVDGRKVTVKVSYPKLAPPAFLSLVLEATSMEPFKIEAVERYVMPPAGPAPSTAAKPSAQSSSESS